MSEAIKLFQYNTLGALMAGLYGGTLTVGELLEHGDLGLGTLDSIDGELIVLDGKAYQAKGSEGKVEVVEKLRIVLNHTMMGSIFSVQSKSKVILNTCTCA